MDTPFSPADTKAKIEEIFRSLENLKATDPKAYMELLNTMEESLDIIDTELRKNKPA
ncbi:MAG: hypothetical protein KBD05_02460 [Candidatus Pacebacteria bacterium]|nr:hypothetical protein [Candidatus Paceibacterota bacterium]